MTYKTKEKSGREIFVKLEKKPWFDDWTLTMGYKGKKSSYTFTLEQAVAIHAAIDFYTKAGVINETVETTGGMK